ncbi:MAG: phosphodiester glycosidase family protein [Oscillospiraceae bacterium]|nr:phosphodiester glycosidase family protein [Oscillospiraceae bacterium]
MKKTNTPDLNDDVLDWDDIVNNQPNQDDTLQTIYEEPSIQSEIEDFSSNQKNDFVAKEKSKRKKKSLKKRLVTIGITLALLTGMYLTVVFSNIPFIEKWRTIYIETAMTTTSHKWLATLFFPQSVIDEVMARRQKNLEAQKKVESTWEDEDVIEVQEDNSEDEFYKKYWELDTYNFRHFLEGRPYLTQNGYDHILIEDMEGDLDLKTKQNDKILVLDTANNLMILEIKGEGYKGKMAIVKEPNQVDLVKSKFIGSSGQEAGSFGQDYDALLVVNASGFVDVGGVGSGGQVKGSMIIDGVEYGSPDHKYGWKFIGLQNNNRMYVRDYPADSVSDYRWGVEFLPALIVDGVSVVDGTFGMGMQPRTAIGQAKDGSILLLIIDGRQVGHSIGATMQDLSAILMRYQAYQAMNVDGGSSSIMWYKGNYVTRSSSVTGIGRYMPDALIVKRAEDEVVINATPQNE